MFVYPYMLKSAAVPPTLGAEVRGTHLSKKNGWEKRFSPLPCF